MNPLLVFAVRVSCPQCIRARQRMTAKLERVLTLRLHQRCISQTRAWRS